MASIVVRFDFTRAGENELDKVVILKPNKKKQVMKPTKVKI